MEIVQVFIISILSFEILSPPRFIQRRRNLLRHKGFEDETDIELAENAHWTKKHESSDYPEAAVQVVIVSEIDKQEERIQKMIQKRQQKKQTKDLQQIEIEDEPSKRDDIFSESKTDEPSTLEEVEIEHEPSKSFDFLKQSQAEEQTNLEKDDKDLQSPENHAVLSVAEAEEDMPARTEEENEMEQSTHIHKWWVLPRIEQPTDLLKHINLGELRKEYEEIKWINEDDKAELYLISQSIPIPHSDLILSIMVEDLIKFKKSSANKPRPTFKDSLLMALNLYFKLDAQKGKKLYTELGYGRCPILTEKFHYHYTNCNVLNKILRKLSIDSIVKIVEIVNRS